MHGFSLRTGISGEVDSRAYLVTYSPRKQLLNKIHMYVPDEQCST